MRRWLGTMLLTGLLATGVSVALAAGEEHREAATEEHGEAKPPENKGAAVSEYVLEHVGDAPEYELTVKGVGKFEIAVAEWFSFLQFERTPGACHQPTPTTMAAYPSLAKATAGCWDLRPTKATLMMWVATALLVLVLFLGRRRDAHGVPRGLFAHVVESLVLFVRDEIATPTIGKAESARYTPYLASLFFFILFTNWLGLIPGLFTGTGAVATTGALALLTFVLVQVAGIRAAGLGGYLGHLTGGAPRFLWVIMVPVEILGLFTKPFALMVRLFANMLAGHMVIFFLLSLILLLHWSAAVVAVPMAVALYCLEIFVGILQAYIFTLLTSLFIGQGVAMAHHGHAEEPQAKAH